MGEDKHGPKAMGSFLSSVLTLAKVKALIILTEWPANGLTGRPGPRSDIRRVWPNGFLECETQPRTNMKTAKSFALTTALAASQP
jgi:hypothetical protein